MAFDTQAPTPWTDEAVMMAVEMDKAGKTGPEIVQALRDQYGIFRSRAAVHKKLNAVRGKANRNGRKNPWTKEAEARLKKLWMDDFSAYEISRRLTDEFAGVFSVYAVNGRRAKLKLPKRQADKRVKQMPVAYTYTSGRNGSEEKHRKPLRSDADIGWYETTTGGVAVVDLEIDQCRWPLADGTFCGAHKTRGAYCAQHAEKAYKGKPDDAH